MRSAAAFSFLAILFSVKDMLSAVTPAVCETVLFDLAAQRVTVNTEKASSAALVAVGVVHGAFNEAPFKFGERFVEQDSAIHHLSDERFQLILHDFILRRQGRVADRVPKS